MTMDVEAQPLEKLLVLQNLFELSNNNQNVSSTNYQTTGRQVWIKIIWGVRVWMMLADSSGRLGFVVGCHRYAKLEVGRTSDTDDLWFEYTANF
ncbi:hypothetical protein TSAR_010089 [Trichomalopsis sarcophagae]|uniref:Uncharacterized protein n=1 Tax=Trichomalopsis sarcophagae TaxID=543379 RepID=A0A232ES09_9HYME|nr:hypothetical protein TSAR_010089 [Trichomalopsis sarcophagae]